MLQQQAECLSLELAHALKAACYAAWSSDPSQCLAAADALHEVAARIDHPEATALAAWTMGIAVLAQGRAQEALGHLDAATADLAAAGQPMLAAEAQVPIVAALAMLGRYDEAEARGLTARDAFLIGGQALAAGKIELNLGNMHMQRDSYAAAEAWFRSAQTRFTDLHSTEHIVMAQIALADALTWQRQFEQAALLYDAAIASAQQAGLTALEATSALNLGILEHLRSRHDHALRWLESARRLFASIDVPYQAALARERLADVYLDLGMAADALEAYRDTQPVYAALDLRYEQAWARAHEGRALMKLGQPAQAGQALKEARALFEADQNAACAAMVDVLRAELAATQHDAAAGVALAANAVQALQTAHAPSWLLLARWMQAEHTRALGDAGAAEPMLRAVLEDALAQSAQDVALHCHDSMGQLALMRGDVYVARAAFLNAVTLIEMQRSRLPAEEFRTAFLSDRIAPYTQMVNLALRAGDAGEAFQWTERARSRALLDMLHGALDMDTAGNAGTDAQLAQLQSLRAELNWCYTQLDERKEAPAQTREWLTALARERETQIHDLTLRLRQHIAAPDAPVADLFDIPRLQAALGQDTALVSYVALAGAMVALVVTDAAVQAVPLPMPEHHVNALVAQLRFQTDALRHGAARMATHMPQLARRAQHYLRQLHTALMEPMLQHIGARRLVILPHRALHYVPFAALFDGERHLIDSHEVCVAPSAGVWLHCLAQPAPRWQRAVLLGVPDERAPRVVDEVRALAPMFASSDTLLGPAATLAALRTHAPKADVLHLACHGVFRPDSPFFSSLRLGDGWLTVRDAYDLNLRAGLVTLSACETGVSAVAPGDELIGLARGFLSAGTPSLLVSLWTVDDGATTQLMQHFYSALLAGERAAAALRRAQLMLRREMPHPFFWAAFVPIGRW